MSERILYYTDSQQIEPNALQCLDQFASFENIDAIRVFPDIHYCAEKAIPVGVAFKTSEVFYPLVTGKDMGCGVAYFALRKSDYLKPFDKVKHYRAFERESHSMTDEGLGGGNHFLSIEESDEYLYIIVHTGSRNLGIYMFQENYSLLQKHNPRHEWLPIELATEEYITEYDRILKYAETRRLEFLQKSLQFLEKNKYVKTDAYHEYADSCHNLLQFVADGVIHRKGSTQLLDKPVVIPLSMSRGSLIVKGNVWDTRLCESLFSCSHGAGRQFSRTDTLKHWYSMKRAEREEYKARFSELLNKWGDFESSIIQEFDFAYKSSDSILESQPYLIPLDETRPIVTVKFTGV